ncbi:MAG: response regulator [Negativicutes bacterium]|nr:response regulator [Negativicutes bacterium]MDR3591877.1 response regulator [Negativicutes bacterium]
MQDPSDKIRVLIVDDSPFSRQLLFDSLDPCWFEVVGYADGLRSALESYRTHLPDVVTVDMDIPDMNGLEVARRMVAEEPDASIVVLSGAKDEEFVKLSEAGGATKLLKKPFEPTELMNMLRSVCDADVVDDAFKNCYPGDFIGAFTNLLKRFTTDIKAQAVPNDLSLHSSGVSVIVGVTGLFSGRMVMDLSAATAAQVATRLLKQEPKSAEQVNVVIAEFAGMVASNASTKLNKEFRGAFLRVSPPGIFTGEKFSISSPNVEIHVWEIETPFGRIRLSVGFKREAI